MNNRADIVKELTELGSPLKDMPAHTPYHAPEGYFNTLADNVLNRANAQRKETYQVPEGYFNQLPQAILEKAKQTDTPKETKVINIGGGSWRNFRMAAAAIILLFVSVGAYQMISSVTPQQNTTIADKLEKVPDNLLLAYVEDNIDDYEMTLLETTANITTSTTENKTTAIEDVSDDVINDYLNNGWN